MTDDTTNTIFLDLLQEERERRQAREQAEECSASLASFIKAGWHVLRPLETYKHNWHIDAICQHLEAVSAGEIKRLQVWIPPGSMKSASVSIFWPAWEWTTNPGLRYWTASYERRLAERLCSESRDLILSDWYQARWGHVFGMRKTGEGYYSNDRGGTRLATAPGSTGIGEHGHRILIDDAINARDADATSGAVLQQTNDWYDATVPGRAADPLTTAQVIIMQRLHENDLAAHVLEIEDWTVLCLPERYEPTHPYAWHGDPRREGELLWPDHRNETASNAFARTLTSHRASGQLQQRPTPREGAILKRDWWRFYDPRIRNTDDWGKLGRMTMVVVTVDCPLKDKQSSDNVAVQCWGVKGADRYLLDLRLGKMNYGGAKRTVREMAQWARRIWRGAPHYLLIENAGYGVEMIEDLKRELTGVTRISPGQDGDKVMRAEAASDGLESGNHFLPGHGPPWQPAYDEARTPDDVVAFVDNCARFPNASHDDDVDAWSQVHNWLRGKNTTPMRTSSALRARLPTR